MISVFKIIFHCWAWFVVSVVSGINPIMCLSKVSFLVLLVAFAFVCVAEDYSYDGTNNNAGFPLYGSTNVPLRRPEGAQYQDGISAARGGNFPNSTLPSPRYVSNVVFGRSEPGNVLSNPRLVTDMLTYWGQFVDHDIDLTPATGGGSCESNPIPIPTSDPNFDPDGVGNKTMGFCRSGFIAGTGTNSSNPRQQPNVITAWLDGSVVYGMSQTRANGLRTMTGGLLRTRTGADGDYLPLLSEVSGVSMANGAQRVPDAQLYAAGDVRANENPVLLSLHTVFLREHNRYVKTLDQSMSDEQLYQAGRRYVTALIQSITFYEYLPTLLGAAMPAYAGYDSSKQPDIDVQFNTAAFRYGHSEVNMLLPRVGSDWLSISAGPMILRDAYFWPDSIKYGVSPFLRGVTISRQDAVDAYLIEDLRNNLFGQRPGAPVRPMDLVAVNIQRGRDHGMGSYCQARVAYGLSSCTTFAAITTDTAVQAALSTAYGGDINLVDTFVGGLSEDHSSSSSNLGPLFTAIIMDQMLRIRDGDRLYFENTQTGRFTTDQIAAIKATRLRDVILRNTDITQMPAEAMVLDTSFLSTLQCATNSTSTTSAASPAALLFSHISYFF